MTREGLREVQVAFYWGAKTAAEITTIEGSGDAAAGDLVYNSDDSSLLVFNSTSGTFVAPYAEWFPGS